MTRSLILMVIINITSIFAISAQENESPWDAILFDISADVLSHDKSGQSEINLFNAVTDEVGHLINPADSVYVFAEGRATIPFRSLLNDSKYNYSNLRLCIGDGTRIYDAILSVANAMEGPRRLLIVTNGLNNGSSFHTKTVSKILRDRGIAVDALCFYLRADSVAMDSVYYPKREFDENFSETIKATGGNFVSVKDQSDIHPAIQSMLKNAGETKTNKKDTELEYDDALLSKTLNRLKSKQLNIVEVDTATHIKYNGVVFKGLNDIVNNIGHPHTGIYIGMDKDRYPCFDEFDRLNENRYYQNIYFADSPQSFAIRQQMIEQMPPKSNYCKLYNEIPLEALPLIYYSGEGDKMFICGLEIVYGE